MDNLGKNRINKESDTDLIGFDGLWQANIEETQNFIRLKQNKDQSIESAEIDLLQKELDDKNFEIQKLQWQLSEREKELKNLYDELHKLLELNKKLNQQLGEFEKLTEKQETIIQILGEDPLAKKEPRLPEFS